MVQENKQRRTRPVISK